MPNFEKPIQSVPKWLVGQTAEPASKRFFSWLKPFWGIPFLVSTAAFAQTETMCIREGQPFPLQLLIEHETKPTRVVCDVVTALQNSEIQFGSKFTLIVRDRIEGHLVLKGERTVPVHSPADLPKRRTPSQPKPGLSGAPGSSAALCGMNGASAAQRKLGGRGTNGREGKHGANGVPGSNGQDGASGPTIILVINDMDAGAAIDIDVSGRPGFAGSQGGDGGQGGRGANGGQGGSGGKRSICHKAGDGGNGGNGGQGGRGGNGGRGGDGGNGGRGGNIYVFVNAEGSFDAGAIKVNNYGGNAGTGGAGGRRGAGGQGGQGGSGGHGGDEFRRANNSVTSSRGATGTDGKRGRPGFQGITGNPGQIGLWGKYFSKSLPETEFSNVASGATPIPLPSF